MILKLATGEGFALYDGLERISYELDSVQRIKLMTPKKMSADGYPEGTVCLLREDSFKGANEDHLYKPFTPDVTYVNERYNSNGEKFAHYARGKKHDGTEMSFVFECGFICNDNGKTIEAIR